MHERRYGGDQISGRLRLNPVRKLTSLRWMAALAMAWINHYLDAQSIEVESIALQGIETDESTIDGMDESLLGHTVCWSRVYCIEVQSIALKLESIAV